MASPSSPWDDCLQYSATTDVGMRRSNNQDSYSVVPASDLPNWNERGHLFMVADGMGAHAAGELASKLAADGIPHTYYTHRDKSPPEAILAAIQETNAQINRRGKANTDFHNMGTTASVLLLLPQGAMVAQVGDSRIYRLRENQLEQLTFDHSLVWEMRASGQIGENAELAALIPKNVITRSLGPHPVVRVDLEGPLPVELGDRFLLCTDGLTNKITDEELGSILNCLEVGEAAQVLVDLANLRGGPDNITVIAIKVTGPRITTRANRADPLTVGGDAAPRHVHPALLVVTGVCFVMSLGMVVIGQPIPALMAGLGGVIAAAVGVLQKYGNIGPDHEVALSGRRRLGRGPHTRTACLATADFVEKLDAISADLREAAFRGNRETSLNQFDQHCQQARAAADVQNYQQSVREYAQAIRFMMQQFRQQRGHQGRDSSTDLL